MIEFVGSKEVLNFAKEENYKTIRMTFENQCHGWKSEYNVFEVSEEEFEKMCDFPDEEWKDSWGWWRWSEGYMFEQQDITMSGEINGHFLMIWCNGDKMEEDVKYCYMGEDEEYLEECYDKWALDHNEYIDLFEYCSEMWSYSAERNITAMAVSLAKLNNMSLTDLFRLSIEM